MNTSDKSPRRTHVEFRSDAFPAQPGEEEQINPGRWGKSLAAFLRTELTKAGLTGGEAYPEDWGWAIPIDNEEFRLFVGCGNYQEYPDGFLCFVDPSKPHVRKLFKKIDTTARVAAVADALDKILAARPGVHSLRWWSESESAT
jgi:hypothetical protein